MGSRIYIISLIALAVLVLVATCAMADQEPNDDYASAETVIAGTHLGTLNIKGDHADYYKVWINPGVHIDVTLTSATVIDKLYVNLEDSDRYSQLELTSSGLRPSKGRWTTSAETPGQYWYLVVTLDTEGGDYTLSFAAITQNDAGLRKDAGGDIATAETISTEWTINGVVDDDDEMDTYRFKAGEGDIIKITLHSGALGDFIHLDLLDFEEWTILSLQSKDDVNGTDYYYTASETPDQWWYVQVWYDTQAWQYDFKVEITRPNDASTRGDAPGTAGAAGLVLPGTHQGHVEDADDVDFYRFRMGEGRYVHIDFSTPTRGDFLYLELWDWEEWTIFGLDSKDNTLEEDWYYSANETELNWWYIKVAMDTAPGNYEFTLEVLHQNDAGTNHDVAGSEAGAYPMAPDVDVHGYLADDDEMDAYAITVEPGGILSVTFVSDAIDDQTLTLYREDDETVLTLESSQDTSADAEHWTANETEGGRWYVVVDMTNNPSEAWGGYTLSIAVGHQDDGGLGIDMPAACENAPELADGEFTCHLGGEDMADAFKVPAQDGWTVTFTLTCPGDVSIAVGVIGDCGSETLLTLSSVSNTPDSRALEVPSGFAPGSYLHVLVTPGAGWTTGSYMVKVETETVPPDDEDPVITFEKPPTKARKDRDLKFQVTATDNEGIEDATLYYKLGDAGVWNDVQLTAFDDLYTVTVPKVEFEDVKIVYYYINFTDGAGNTASYGDWSSPKEVKVTKPPEDNPGFGLLVAVAAVTLALFGASRGRR